MSVAIRLRRTLATAVADSAMASLATFAVGLYATRHLDLEVLGGYGIAFAATFQLGSMTVTQLYFTPVEVGLVEHDPRAQLAALRRSTVAGLPAAAAVAVLVGLVSTALMSGLGGRDRLVLALGAAAVAALSPAQDHVRRVLHQAVRSPLAARTSVVQLGVAIVALGGLAALDVPAVWIPLPALAAANAVSMAYGVVAAGRAAGGARAAPRPPTRALLSFGGRLAAAGQFEQLGGFAGVVLLASLAGSAAMGRYEAARQLAQPLFVLAGGMLAVLRPRVMRAATSGDASTARQLSSLYGSILLGVGLGAAALLGPRWSFNPLVGLLPNAYSQRGVLAALLVATAVAFSTYILAAQVISARRERELLRITSTNQLVYCGVVAALAGRYGAMALPVASLAHSAAWLLRVRPILRSIYRAPVDRPAPVPGAAGGPEPVAPVDPVVGG